MVQRPIETTADYTTIRSPTSSVFDQEHRNNTGIRPSRNSSSPMVHDSGCLVHAVLVRAARAAETVPRIRAARRSAR
jgi:hypothetical protein